MATVRKFQQVEAFFNEECASNDFRPAYGTARWSETSADSRRPDACFKDSASMISQLCDKAAELHNSCVMRQLITHLNYVGRDGGSCLRTIGTVL